MSHRNEYRTVLQSGESVIGDPPANQDPPPAEEGGPLTDSHFIALERARKAQRPIRRAAAVAKGSAGMILSAAGISCMLGMFDATNFIIATMLLIVGMIELRGAQRLRAGEIGAARMLMFNQLAIGVLLVLYAGRGLLIAATSDLSGFGLSPETAAYLQQSQETGFEGIEQMARATMFLLYGTMIVVAFFFQGGLALYYACKERRVRDWHRQTPAWTQEVMRKAA